MANVILQQGDLIVLDFVRLSASLLKLVRLYKNDHLPTVTDTNAEYMEADFSGYSEVDLAQWNAAFINDDGKGEIAAALATFTHDGGGTSNTIYGAYVVDQFDNVIFAERFAAPRIMGFLGDAIFYLPRLTSASA